MEVEGDKKTKRRGKVIMCEPKTVEERGGEWGFGNELMKLTLVQMNFRGRRVVKG